jgi:toxin FitB
VFPLDTSFLSEPRRPERADPSLLKFAAERLGEGVFISAVSVLEIEDDALLLARRDKLQRAGLAEWLEESFFQNIPAAYLM